LKIVRLEGENVKRLRAVDITFKPGVNWIGGKNGAGKSSLLDMLKYAFGGKAAQCEVPLRVGTEKGFIRATTEEFIVTTILTPTGSQLSVTSRDGKSKFTSPQSLLNGLTNRFTFNPLEFLHMEPAKQRDTFKALVGLDFSALDAERKRLFDERALAGRDVHGRQTQIDALPYHPDAPAKEVSVAELSKELAAAQSQNQTRRDLVNKSNAADRAVEFALALAKSNAADIEETERRLADLKSQAKDIAQKLAAERARAATALADIETVSEINCYPIITKIEAADATNKKVRSNATCAAMQASFAEARAEFDRMTEKIEAIDAEKVRLLKEAKVPIPGMSFSDTGVLLNGLPFEQASGAEQLRVSVAMGFVTHPDLNTLCVYDASLLDDDSRAIVVKTAEGFDGQLLLEVVTTDPSKASIIIEDGAVKAAEAVANA
jgi:DNA repair exonuclease SbcCD ATPase subunit